MSELGDILELFYGCSEPFESVRASVRHWRNVALWHVASREAMARWGRKAIKPENELANSEQTSATFLRIWMAKPLRARIEEHLSGAPSGDFCVKARDGASWAWRDAEGHVDCGTDERRAGAMFTDAQRHFDPGLVRRFFERLTLESRGFATTAGRPCVRLRAMRRPGTELWPHWLPMGADEFELHADLERSVLLALIARYKGTVFSISEVLEVYFDEPLPTSLFECRPEVGEQVRPLAPVIEPIDIIAAARALPFTVLTPSCLPDSTYPQLKVLHSPSRPESPRCRLDLLYHGGDEGFLIIEESTTANPTLGEYEWENVGNPDQPLLISEPTNGGGVRLVSFKTYGTHVLARAETERNRLIEVVKSLVPAVERSADAGQTQGDAVRRE